MKTDSTMIVRDQLYIGGKWVKPAGTGTLDVTNSSTEEVMARIPDGTPADVDRAVAAAKAAFPAWSQTPVAERAAMLQKLSAGLAARMDEIGMLVAQEVGMPLPMAKQIQAGLPTMVMGSYAKLVGEFEYEEKVGNSIVVREPVGVVGCITPWNYPLHQVVAKVAPAIAAGCTVVLKPSEVAPLTAFVLAEIIDQAGLPAGVFNLVTGTGPVVGEAIAAHPDVDMVSFTGSTRAGKRVSELAAKTVKRVALELGGKSANVILDDADFEKAVKAGVGNCYMNSGQTCSAWTRMLVPKERQDEAIAIAKKAAESFTVGDPVKGESRLGPLISDVQQKRVRGYIEKGIAEGATLVTGGAEQPRGPRSRLLREAHRVRQRQERHDDRAGGDLRPGALDPARTRTRTTRCGSPTTPSTGSPAASGRRTPSAPSGWRSACAPARSTSTAAASTRWRRSAATSSRAGVASSGSSGSRSSSRSSRCRPDRRSRLALSRVEEDRPLLGVVDDQHVVLGPRVVAVDRAGGFGALGIENDEGPGAVRERAAEDDLAGVEQRVHEPRMVVPVGLFPHRLGGIPPRSVAHEHGDGLRHGVFGYEFRAGVGLRGRRRARESDQPPAPTRLRGPRTA